MESNKFLKENEEELRKVREPLVFENLEFIKVVEGDGNVELGIEVKESLMNANGVMHGGMIYTLADTCAGFGAYALGYRVTTIQGSINYLRPATSGRIVGKSNVKHLGRKTIVTDVEIYNDQNKLMASAVFTMAVMGKA